jgi:phosphoribosylanthranilate isomerase
MNGALVKICGITRPIDAEAAVDAGANALGFVFWPDSPRFVDPFRARAIVAGLPPFVTPVGVFVDQPSDFLNGVATLVKLGAVQLHGGETPEYAKRLNRPVIKALGLRAEAMGAVDIWPSNVRILVDVHDPVRRGGTGVAADWTAAAAVASTRPILLAGGLTPDNVGEALARVRPFGIDVSSGVESAPGVKDHTRLAAFMRAVHDSEHATRP